MGFWNQSFFPGTTDKTSQTSQAFDKLEQDVSLKTQGAVDEGRRDVHEAAAVGGLYLGAAIDTLKVCFPSPFLRHSVVLRNFAFRSQSHLPSSIIGTSGTDPSSEEK